VVGIRYPADILWLVAVLTRNIPLNPLPPLTFPQLQGFPFGIDPVEASRARVERVEEPAPYHPAVQAGP
jgi:hypothetical protein